MSVSAMMLLPRHEVTGDAALGGVVGAARTAKPINEGMQRRASVVEPVRPIREEAGYRLLELRCASRVRVSGTEMTGDLIQLAKQRRQAAREGVQLIGSDFEGAHVPLDFATTQPRSRRGDAALAPAASGAPTAANGSTRMSLARCQAVVSSPAVT
jgi:hypothetical protein